ncbi:MAG: LysR family transcriptional regulator [Bacillota bacterium]|nr:LysR family transcriptional regulator [Bacillota bacterium]
MELRVLNYFLTVAREENITRAAQFLHVTQPTLSRQLMQLEEELGVKLFNRSNHSIVLTEEGMLLKRRAQELLSLADKTKKELKQEKELSGEIFIGSGEFRSFSMFATFLASFMERHPRVRFDLYSGNADNIKERIERGLIDVGLVSAPVDISKYEFLRLPEREHWGFLVHEDSPLAEKEIIVPEDLAGQKLMASPRTLIQEELENWMGDVADRVEVIGTFNLLYNAAMLVQQKMGIALCIDLDAEYSNLKFVPLSPQMDGGSVLIWKKNQVSSPTVEALLEHTKQCVKGITENT